MDLHIHGHEITGILTTADFQLVTVSLVVFGFVLAAEEGIDELIELHLPTGWADLLTRERLARVEDVFTERSSRNEQIDRIACLNLEDRLRILEKSRELRAAVGMSGKQIKKSAEVLKRLRDTLAHGGSLLEVRGDARAGIRAAQQARAFAHQVWDAVRDVTFWKSLDPGDAPRISRSPKVRRATRGAVLQSKPMPRRPADSFDGAPVAKRMNHSADCLHPYTEARTLVQ